MPTNTEIFVLAVTTITAIATSISAYVSWKSWQGGVVAEWDFSWQGSGKDRVLYGRLEIRNHTNTALQAVRVDVPKFPILDLRTGGKEEEKHESWGLRSAPLSRREIRPHGSEAFGFFISPDWVALEANPSRRFVRRSISDTPLLIQASVASKDSRRRMIRVSTKISIAREMIVNMASEISR